MLSIANFAQSRAAVCFDFTHFTRTQTQGDIRIKAGNTLPMRNIPVGSTVHNVEMKPGKGGQLARSAGTYVQIVARDGAYVTLRLRSGEMRKVEADCRASFTQNAQHMLSIANFAQSRAAVCFDFTHFTRTQTQGDISTVTSNDLNVSTSGTSQLTIRTAPRTSRWFCTKTASAVTSWPRKA